MFAFAEGNNTFSPSGCCQRTPCTKIIFACNVPMKQPSEVQHLLAHNLKSARRKLGYSQQELAERAELSPGHMNDLEQGRKWVSSFTLQRLADALGLEPFMLLLPHDEASRTDQFSLLTEYAASVRVLMEESLDRSLKNILKKRPLE
jgi:transcriptional regulator with XRE-family HTH domain